MRTICAIFAAALVVAFSLMPVGAQEPADKDELKRLQAEVEKLRGQVKDLESKLSKLQAEQPKADAPKKGKKGGFGGGIDLDQIRKLTEGLKGKGGKKGFFDPDQLKKGNIDIDQLKKLADGIGNGGIDINQIMKLIELQQQLQGGGKKPAEKKKLDEKKPEEKKLPGGATE